MFDIQAYLNRLDGVQPCDSVHRSHIENWAEWYAGKVDKFHKYSVYNGVQRRGRERSSLCMAQTVAADWASLLFNEKCLISVDDEARQAVLDELLEVNRFQTGANRTIERAFALGTGAFSVYIDGNGLPCIDYHDARNIYPLAWKHGDRVTECAFSSIQTRKGETVVYLKLYRLDPDGTYRIDNKWFGYEDGKELPAPDGIDPVIHTGITSPLFQIIRPNICNNMLQTTSPMGISVYANAIDCFKEVDTIFDSLREEFNLGRKRLMIPASMIQRDPESGMMLFDPNDLLYTAYTPDADSTAGLHDLGGDLRISQHIEGLRGALNTLSFKCGLGTGRYDFDVSGGMKTATEVVSEQSDLFQSLKRHELILEEALIGLVKALFACMGVDVDVNVTFDDSIIQDTATVRANAREDVAAGLMSKKSYLVNIVGLSEEQADAELKRIADEARVTPDLADMLNAVG